MVSSCVGRVGRRAMMILEEEKEQKEEGLKQLFLIKKVNTQRQEYVVS